jgi:hypothetical protein
MTGVHRATQPDTRHEQAAGLRLSARYRWASEAVEPVEPPQICEFDGFDLLVRASSR